MEKFFHSCPWLDTGLEWLSGCLFGYQPVPHTCNCQTPNREEINECINNRWGAAQQLPLIKYIILLMTAIKPEYCAVFISQQLLYNEKHACVIKTVVCYWPYFCQHQRRRCIQPSTGTRTWSRSLHTLDPTLFLSTSNPNYSWRRETIPDKTTLPLCTWQHEESAYVIDSSHEKYIK